MCVHMAPQDSLPYASAVGACAFAAQWPSSLALLEEMTERRLAPEMAAYNAAIMACQRSSLFDEALPLRWVRIRAIFFWLDI